MIEGFGVMELEGWGAAWGQHKGDGVFFITSIPQLIVQ